MADNSSGGRVGPGQHTVESTPRATQRGGLGKHQVAPGMPTQYPSATRTFFRETLPAMLLIGGSIYLGSYLVHAMGGGSGLYNTFNKDWMAFVGGGVALMVYEYKASREADARRGETQKEEVQQADQVHAQLVASSTAVLVELDRFILNLIDEGWEFLAKKNDEESRLTIHGEKGGIRRVSLPKEFFADFATGQLDREYTFHLRPPKTLRGEQEIPVQSAPSRHSRTSRGMWGTGSTFFVQR